MAKTAKKVRRITGMSVKVEPPNSVTRPDTRHGSSFKPNTPEYWRELTRSCEEWAAVICGHFREHYSLHKNHVAVDNVINDVCSQCGERWETTTRSGVLQCSTCKAPVEE